MEEPSVVAVVVTYNRKVLLAECMEAILCQTFPVSELILIDNASTDGTKDYLREKGILEDSRINYILMDTNTGGSGGFYEGLRLSRESNYDWVWLMDDDTIPQPECLENLIAAQLFLEEKQGKVSFLASSVFGENGEFMNLPKVNQKPSSNGYAYWYQFLDKGLLNISAATFVSLLIKKDAVDKCGLPCKDFFIWSDDMEYTMRLTQYYADAYMVGKSVAIHKRQNAKPIEIKYETDPTRIRRFHYFYRNQAITNRYYGRPDYRPWRMMLRNTSNAIKMLKKPNGFLKARVIMKGSFESLNDYKKFKSYIDGQIQH